MTFSMVAEGEPSWKRLLTNMYLHLAVFIVTNKPVGTNHIEKDSDHLVDMLAYTLTNVQS